MPEITFIHKPSNQEPLTIITGLDDVEWGYNLNTVTYPTYGGEVVQILSAYTDNISIGGTVRSYRQMEGIYSWFLRYMQGATQGTPGDRYNQQPVRMTYPARNWWWDIYPLSLPGFLKGRDVVAPTWRLEGAVYDEEDTVREFNVKGAVDNLKKLTLGVGYDPDNPFSEPFKGGTKPYSVEDEKEEWEKAGDRFNKLIPKYMKGDYDSILGEIGSQPTLLNKRPGQADTQRDTQPNGSDPGGRRGRGA